MTTFDKLEAEFEKHHEGTFFTGEDGNYYIKPAQSSSHHLEGMLIQLFSGRLVHYCIPGKLTPIYGHEIRW